MEANMKRKINTFEEAIAIYAEYYGNIPKITKIMDLYYEYRKNAKQYDGFKDWLIYTQD
jgi:hypothetical protein